jgi:Rieske Fe-S protein
MEVERTGLRNSRRDFINWILGFGFFGWLASVLYPIFRYIIPPKMPEAKISTVKVGRVDEFVPGSGRIFKFGNKPGILIRLESGEFRAFSAICTHLDCTVQYREDLKIIWCACHNGKYDLNGRNIAGPPPRPLDRYRVILKGDEVYVTKEV